MTGTYVNWPPPLTRLNPFYPGQFGVPGTDSETGLRLHCEGTVFYVDPNHVDTNDQRDGTNPTAPLTTIATALTKCQAYRGDVIVVMANNSWQYGDAADGRTTAIAEEVTIDVPGVRIIGLSQSGMGVYWTPASDGGTCITVAAIDVTIEGFVFTEGAYTGCDAIYCEWDGATLYGENLTVRNCVFDDTVDTAIQLEYAWYNHIHNCVFWECDEYGIYVDAGGSGTEYTYIHDNIFHNCDVAIALLGGCDHNHVKSNQIYNSNAVGAAAAANEGINTTGGARNMVCDNWFSCLLPVPANGDWDDLNTASATDAWVNNHCMDGDNVTNPT